MKIENRRLPYLCLLLLLVVVSWKTNAQSKNVTFSIEEICELAQKNNQTLQVAKAGVEVAAQQVAVQRLNHLPVINTSLSAFYLGNVNIYDSDFSDHLKIDMPHFGNSFTIEAQHLIFKGNMISRSVELAGLQQQLAVLKAQEANQSIKFLVTSSYLDLFRLYNQHSVYKKNIELAETRLKNILAMYEQDLVTKDNIIRTRFGVTNLQLALEQVENQIRIVNDQLTTATGIDKSITIIPDSTILQKKPTVSSHANYQSLANQNNSGILVVKQKTKIAEKAMEITKTERSPALSLFAGNSLQRPLTSSSPAVDKYSNGWQVGASLSFNISSLYTSKKKIQLSQLQLIQSQEAVIAQEQNTDLTVNAAFSNYEVAVSQLKALEENKNLADENYRMIEKKYENQLALLIDLLDASSSKLSAELQYANAEINILFAYYKILNATSTL